MSGFIGRPQSEGSGNYRSAEAFNLLNRPQFGPPNPFQGAPAFGAIRSMENLPRILQLGLKLIY